MVMGNNDQQQERQGSYSMQVVHYRMENMEKALGDVRESLSDIKKGLHDLVRLEEQHAATRESLGRAHARIDDLDEESSKCTRRTGDIETALAGITREVSIHSWMLRIIYGTVIATAIGAAIKFS